MSNEIGFELWLSASKRAVTYAGLLGKYKSLTGNMIMLLENLKKSDRGYLIDLEYLKKVKDEIETEFEETVNRDSQKIIK
jgi:hypothetical protein